jgi:hypothetical protein
MKKDLEKACAGDRAAASTVVNHLTPVFERWATTHLPRDTAARIAPAVRNGLQKALSELKQGTRCGEGAFVVQARTAILQELAGGLGDISQSFVARSVGRRQLEAYERGLKQLGDVSREALVLRVELGYPFARVAEAIGAASGEEARAIVSGSLLRMSELMEAL